MNLDQINDVPDIVMEFLEYHSTVRGHSDKTVAGYYLDLKILFRYIKRRRNLVPRDTPFQEIDIIFTDEDISFSCRDAELTNFRDGLSSLQHRDTDFRSTIAEAVISLHQCRVTYSLVRVDTFDMHVWRDEDMFVT